MMEYILYFQIDTRKRAGASLLFLRPIPEIPIGEIMKK